LHIQNTTTIAKALVVNEISNAKGRAMCGLLPVIIDLLIIEDLRMNETLGLKFDIRYMNPFGHELKL
jgi:hypothetical protein